MNKNANTKRNESGQSTIEFILSFTVAIGFIVSFYKVAMLFTNGYLVHYAVFQASRAYMVAEQGANQPNGSDALARREAKKVFDFYNLSELIPGFETELYYNEPEANLGNSTNVYVGVGVVYNDSLLIPATSKKIPIPLTSESFLGLEPTRAECFVGICTSFRELGAQCLVHTTVSDNGC